MLTTHHAMLRTIKLQSRELSFAIFCLITLVRSNLLTLDGAGEKLSYKIECKNPKTFEIFLSDGFEMNTVTIFLKNRSFYPDSID